MRQEKTANGRLLLFSFIIVITTTLSMKYLSTFIFIIISTAVFAVPQAHAYTNADVDLLIAYNIIRENSVEETIARNYIDKRFSQAAVAQLASSVTTYEGTADSFVFDEDVVVESVAQSTVVQHASYAGDLNRGIYEIEIEISGGDDGVWLPNGILGPVGTKDQYGSRFSILQSDVAFAGDAYYYIADTTTTIHQDDRYFVAPDTSERFTYRFELQPINGGVFGIALNEFYLGRTSVGDVATVTVPIVQAGGFATQRVQIPGNDPTDNTGFTIEGISKSASVDDADFSGDEEKGIFEIEVQITAFDGDMWIPNEVTVLSATSQAGFMFNITESGQPFQGTITAHISEDTSDAQVNNRYVISKGQSERFTIHVELRTAGDASGNAYGIELAALHYSPDSSIEKLTRATIPDTNEFETTKVSIDGISESDACSNIRGYQETVPDNYQLRNGLCIFVYTRQPNNTIPIDDGGIIVGDDDDDEEKQINDPAKRLRTRIASLSRDTIAFGQRIAIRGVFSGGRTNRVVFTSNQTGQRFVIDNQPARNNRVITVRLPEQKYRIVGSGRSAQRIGVRPTGGYTVEVVSDYGRSNGMRLRITN